MEASLGLQVFESIKLKALSQVAPVEDNFSIERCALDMDLNSSDMIELVDTFYSDLSKWEVPPFLALLLGLQKVCSKYLLND